jgi:hypothetical protein
MKGLVIWFLKKIYGIDVDSLREDNKRLMEENGRHVSRNNSLKKDKESLSEKAMRLEKEKSELENTNHKLKSNNEETNKENAGLRTFLDDANRENNRLKSSLDEANKKIKSLEEKRATEPIPEAPNGDDENQDEIENLKRQFDNLQKQLEQTNVENQKLRAKTSNQDSTIDNLKKEIKDQKVTADLQKQTIKTLQNDKRKFEEENRYLEEELRKLKGDTLPPINVSGDGFVITPEPPVGPEPPEPPVDETKRTIDTVIDIETDKEINAKSFFAQPEGVIFKMRTELEKAIYLHRPKYVCKYCGQMVKISGRKSERGMARFFSHLRDSDDCDYKTTTGRTRREINREKFARCNEGERHKFLKAEIAKYLEKTEGVTDVRTENTVKGNHPILRWRRPDVIANYRGQEVVFELQLSTTFVSVIAERDLFYRLNKKHIIWVSNFDEQGEHVDLTNMMVKDIYYNNRMNLFIFDLDAQRKSEELGELVLKCNWLTPDGNWQYPNGNTSDKLGGKYIRLSDFTFDNTYKPYYVDAEQAYYVAHPEFKIRVASIEEENKEILAELDRQWEEELIRGEAELQKTEERIQEIIEDNEIDGDIKSTKKYIIAQRSGLYGLVTYDGLIRMPFIYDEIKAHRGWYEGKRDGAIEIFDSNYELIDTDIRRIEKLGDTNKKYVKVNGDDWLWGIMDNNAQPITRSIYSKVDIWSLDKFIAIRDGQYCILNKEGHIIIAGYDYISELDSDGVATIAKDGREGRIDSECQVLKTNTEKISDSLYKINKLGKWGAESNDGTIVVPCEYDDLGSFNNGVIGLNGVHFTQLETNLNADCPVRVKYVSRNERKMLIFKVGNREAFMNLRQQQKAAKNGLKPAGMTHMYFSHVNKEKNLLYLSATPVKALVGKQQMDTKDSDIQVGSIIEGSVVHVDKNSFILKSEEGQTAYINRSMYGEYYSNTAFIKGQNVRVEKVGFDSKHNKHVWKILSVHYTL